MSRVRHPKVAPPPHGACAHGYEHDGAQRDSTIPVCVSSATSALVDETPDDPVRSPGGAPCRRGTKRRCGRDGGGRPPLADAPGHIHKRRDTLPAGLGRGGGPNTVLSACGSAARRERRADIHVGARRRRCGEGGRWHGDGRPRSGSASRRKSVRRCKPGSGLQPCLPGRCDGGALFYSSTRGCPSPILPRPSGAAGGLCIHGPSGSCSSASPGWPTKAAAAGASSHARPSGSEGAACNAQRIPCSGRSCWASPWMGPSREPPPHGAGRSQRCAPPLAPPVRDARAEPGWVEAGQGHTPYTGSG